VVEQNLTVVLQKTLPIPRIAKRLRASSARSRKRGSDVPGAQATLQIAALKVLMQKTSVEAVTGSYGVHDFDRHSRTDETVASALCCRALRSEFCDN
jgi:hypothetical protein